MCTQIKNDFFNFLRDVVKLLKLKIPELLYIERSIKIQRKNFIHF